MKSDGQLYQSHHKGERIIPPPSLDICDLNESEPVLKPKGRIPEVSQELLLIGLILLIVSDKCETDIPLVLALVYVLFWK